MCLFFLNTDILSTLKSNAMFEHTAQLSVYI